MQQLSKFSITPVVDIIYNLNMMLVSQGSFFFPEPSGVLFSLNLGLAADFNHSTL